MEFDTLTTDPALAERLRAYFSAIDALSDVEQFNAYLGLLSLKEMIEKSIEFRSFHPLVQVLDGIILDDPETSNHHMLIGTSALAGMVFYLSHDDDSRVVFADLPAYLAAAGQAFEDGDFLDEHHAARSPIAPDQVALRALLSSLALHDDSDVIIPALVPSLELTDPDFLIALIGEDFTIGEAVAREIIRRPAPELLPVAQFCENHSHPQVSGPGAKARQAIAAL